MTTEIWKPIPGYEGYEASSAGRVRSLPRIDARGHRRVGKMLTLSVHYRGYRTAQVGGKNHFVHKLVMLAFVGPRPAGQHINHINGRKDDNQPANLEYITPQENSRHARDVLKRQTGVPGERNSHARLTAAQVRAIRAARTGERGEQLRLATAYGVSNQTISAIFAGRIWTSV